jgi:hypothetical protein
MDRFLSLARRAWVADPTLENARRYISWLERGTPFSSSPARNRRRSSASVNQYLDDALNNQLDIIRYGQPSYPDEDSLIEVQFTRRPRRHMNRRQRHPQHPLQGIKVDQVSMIYHDGLDGESLKLSEIIQLVEVIQDYLGGEIVDISTRSHAETRMGGHTSCYTVVEIWITYPDLF